MSDSLTKTYHTLLEQGKLAQDVLQRQAVAALTERETAIATGTHCKGLYLHGRVGRGKTLLMDMFFESLTTDKKIRLHFHHFMYLIHQRLRQIQGQVNPLEYIAKELSLKAKILCFDEFFVNDIADAMLLGGIFNALHECNVMVVTTSNTLPDQLYAGGLARDRFLPTIALIKQHLQYLSLDGEVDYRTTFTEYNNLYFKDDGDGFTQYVSQHDLANNNLDPSTISILNRQLNILGQQGTHIWFDFLSLCDGPRSQNDYICLADSFDVLVLSDVIQMGGKVELTPQAKGIEDEETNYLLTPASDVEVGELDDCARRFIALIDEFYDRCKLVVISSDVAMLSLYQGGRVNNQFKRTYSRLTEMQSVSYQDRVKKRVGNEAAKLFA